VSTASNHADGSLEFSRAEHRLEGPCVATDSHPEPAAVAVDLGSGETRLWAIGDGIRQAPSVDESPRRPTPLVRRGRIVDAAGCVALLTRLLHTFPQALPAGPLVVACRPVLASADDDEIRRVVTEAFAPSRVLLIDTARAAAIASGTATGAVLLADVGAQLTEVALLLDGRVAAARIADMGTHDTTAGRGPRLLAGIVARLVADIAHGPDMLQLTTATLTRGMIVVGDGATIPELTMRLAANLEKPVLPARSPRLAALSGAGLAATAARRHPAITGR
jgi:rod shape-determining protein MreB